ncbi:hypothetical protein [Aeromicrobium duanguangcaii]|uniref:Hcy-binding domain-containing protein n=1 Tax=Aeromicrobium duanguangcaii TaxID=2968086 RepID=A0ABY5KBK1_9ACTN|nr:hypothetical protein [Aeromicrobium duanguangcaii]MCD9154759.1 hypothetical protein [Aeromicrobium duanguangcaii]UUI67827.1 hypothetical protein NP095_11540 [Aeromicrobium duanguangcaii]
MLGPRGDGYATSGPIDPDAAAVGVVRAAADVGLGVGVGFTVETDGRLPDGTTLSEAIDAVDAFASLEVLGGCCGTDARHVSAMWGV